MILGNTEYLALALTYEGDRRAGELRAGEGGKQELSEGVKAGAEIKKALVCCLLLLIIQSKTSS